MNPLEAPLNEPDLPLPEITLSQSVRYLDWDLFAVLSQLEYLPNNQSNFNCQLATCDFEIIFTAITSSVVLLLLTILLDQCLNQSLLSFCLINQFSIIEYHNNFKQLFGLINVEDVVAHNAQLVLYVYCLKNCLINVISMLCVQCLINYGAILHWTLDFLCLINGLMNKKPN